MREETIKDNITSHEYLVLDTSLATSKIFKLEDGYRWHHWYLEEEKWYWTNTAHWNELKESKVLFRTNDFKDILPFMKEYTEEVSEILLEELNDDLEDSTYRDSLILKVKENESIKLIGLTHCIDSIKVSGKIELLKNRLIAIRNSIGEL